MCPVLFETALGFLARRTPYPVSLSLLTVKWKVLLSFSKAPGAGEVARWQGVYNKKA